MSISRCKLFPLRSWVADGTVAYLYCTHFAFLVIKAEQWSRATLERRWWAMTTSTGTEAAGGCHCINNGQEQRVGMERNSLFLAEAIEMAHIDTTETWILFRDVAKYEESNRKTAYVIRWNTFFVLGSRLIVISVDVLSLGPKRKGGLHKQAKDAYYYNKAKLSNIWHVDSGYWISR